MTVLTVAISLVLKELPFFLKIISVSSVELVARWTDWEHFEREQVKVCHLQHLSHFSLSTFDQTFQSTQKEKIRSDYLQSFYRFCTQLSVWRESVIVISSTVSNKKIGSRHPKRLPTYLEQHQYLFLCTHLLTRQTSSATQGPLSPRTRPGAGSDTPLLASQPEPSVRTETLLSRDLIRDLSVYIPVTGGSFSGS